MAVSLEWCVFWVHKGQRKIYLLTLICLTKEKSTLDIYFKLEQLKVFLISLLSATMI